MRIGKILTGFAVMIGLVIVPISSANAIEVPGTATTPTVRLEATLSSIAVEWDAVPNATAYRYRIREGSDPWSATTQTVTRSTLFDGLDASTEYTVAVGVRLRTRWQNAWTTATLETLTPEAVPPTPGQWVTTDDDTAVYRDTQTRHRTWFFDPFLHTEPGWDAGRIGFLVQCTRVGFDQVDPIVSPGAATSPHLHEFFGNPNVDPFTTTQSLVDTPRSAITCTDSNDKSAYWSPAVRQGGKLINAKSFSAYYRSETPDVVPMPLGLRVVAGNAAATENQHEQVGYWVSERDPKKPNKFPIDCHERRSTVECAGTPGLDAMMTRLAPHLDIVLVINYPNCWDGVHLDSPDHQSHMAYTDEALGSCPATHPIKVPQLTTRTSYDTLGGSGFHLASGPWFTFHQDFWNAWSPDQMADLTEQCILDGYQCRPKSTPALVNLGQFVRLVP